MASSDVGKSHVCFRTIKTIAYGDGSNGNIFVRTCQSAIASSVSSSCLW